MTRRLSLLALWLLVPSDAALAQAAEPPADPFRLVPARELPALEPLHGDAPPAAHELLARGLAWLARAQEEDGRWCAAGTGKPVGRGDGLATSLALLTFLGEGHTHRFGPHKRGVTRALVWVQQWDPARPEAASLSGALDHALRTMALAEAYAVSRDFTLKRHVEDALGLLCKLRRPDGGWSLVPDQPSDALATVHAVLALKAVVVAGLKLPEGALEEAAGRLRALADAGGRSGLRSPGDGLSLTLEDPSQAPPLPLFSAGSALARVFAGEKRHVDGLKGAWEQLDAAPPHARLPEPAYWWLGAYATFQRGGEGWPVWLAAAQQAIGATQHEGKPDDPLSGSWDPVGLWGGLGGRPATSAACLQALELGERWRRAQEGR